MTRERIINLKAWVGNLYANVPIPDTGEDRGCLREVLAIIENSGPSGDIEKWNYDNIPGYAQMVAVRNGYFGPGHVGPIPSNLPSITTTPSPGSPTTVEEAFEVLEIARAILRRTQGAADTFYDLVKALAVLKDAVRPTQISDWSIAELLSWLEGCETDDERWDAVEDFLKQEFGAEVEP